VAAVAQRCRSERYASSGASLSAFCVLKHPTIRAKISNIALQPEEGNVCQLILKWTKFSSFTRYLSVECEALSTVSTILMPRPHLRNQ